MQLPADDELVLVSGNPPIRAHKLRYYQDSNFAGRVLPAPALGKDGYLDRPATRTDDWTGQVRKPHAELNRAWSDLVTDSDQDEGGLKRHPALPEEAPRTPEPEHNPDERLIEDDFDNPPAGKGVDPLRRMATLRRAHAINRGDDDLLPKF